MFDSADFPARKSNQERRSVPRTRSYLEGKIAYVSNSFSADCVVRNISETGAKLTIPTNVSYPEDPLLIIVKHGVAHETTTVWREKDDFGVRFVRTHDITREVPGHLLGARRLWVEKLPR